MKPVEAQIFDEYKERAHLAEAAVKSAAKAAEMQATTRLAELIYIELLSGKMLITSRLQTFLTDNGCNVMHAVNGNTYMDPDTSARCAFVLAAVFRGVEREWEAANHGSNYGGGGAGK